MMSLYQTSVQMHCNLERPSGSSVSLPSISWCYSSPLKRKGGCQLDEINSKKDLTHCLLFPGVTLCNYCALRKVIRQGNSGFLDLGNFLLKAKFLVYSGLTREYFADGILF
jgi:hypothetical protein